MCSIVTLVTESAGSNSTAALIAFTHRFTRRAGIHTSNIMMRNLRLSEPSATRPADEAVESARALLDQADGVIVVTPTYRTSRPELRSTYVGLLADSALRYKLVLPVVTGASADEAESLDRSLEPLLAGFGSCTILRSIFVAETGIRQEHGGLVRFDEPVEYGLRTALGELITSIRQVEAA